MFPVVGSVTPRPDERPIVIGLVHVRPPSTDRTASSCVVFGAERSSGLVEMSANTSSSEPSRLTRILLMPGQLFEVCGSYTLRGADQLRPPFLVVEIRL